jgi:hypothetical protein
LTPPALVSAQVAANPAAMVRGTFSSGCDAGQHDVPHTTSGGAHASADPSRRLESAAASASPSPVSPASVPSGEPCGGAEPVGLELVDAPQASAKEIATKGAKAKVVGRFIGKNVQRGLARLGRKSMPIVQRIEKCGFGPLARVGKKEVER